MRASAWDGSAVLLLVMVLMTSSAMAQAGNPVRFPIGDGAFGYAIPAGAVTNTAKAIAVARPVLVSIYGAQTIRSEEPLTATVEGGVWVVMGTLACTKSWLEKLSGGRCGAVGGTAVLKLSPEDGRVLYVNHYK